MLPLETALQREDFDLCQCPPQTLQRGHTCLGTVCVCVCVCREREREREREKE